MGALFIMHKLCHIFIVSLLSVILENKHDHNCCQQFSTFMVTSTKIILSCVGVKRDDNTMTSSYSKWINKKSFKLTNQNNVKWIFSVRPILDKNLVTSFICMKII